MANRFIYKAGVALVTALCLSSCAGLTGDPTKDLPAASASLGTASASATDVQNAVAKLTASDLAMALADAQAHQDTPAMTCYGALLPVVQAQEQAPANAQVGVITVFQRGRDLVQLVRGNGGIAVACAALKQSVTGDILGLGALFGIP